MVCSDLSQKVDSVKEENMKLRSENQVLGQYIENLLAASTVFQPTSPRTKKKFVYNLFRTKVKHRRQRNIVAS